MFKSLVRVNTNRDGIGLAGVHRHHAQTAVVAELVYVGAGQCLGQASGSECESDLQASASQSAGLSYHVAVAKAIPSVVRIYTTNSATAGIEKGSGSGVIIDKQGYIVTNQHVISGASQIQVVLDDNRHAKRQSWSALIRTMIWPC